MIWSLYLKINFDSTILISLSNDCVILHVQRNSMFYDWYIPNKTSEFEFFLFFFFSFIFNYMYLFLKGDTNIALIQFISNSKQ
jgi:hypothetical protein